MQIISNVLASTINKVKCNTSCTLQKNEKPGNSIKTHFIVIITVLFTNTNNNLNFKKWGGGGASWS